MEENKYIFKAVDPRNDEDVEKYIDLSKGLDEHLKVKRKMDENFFKWKRCHLGAPEYVFPDEYKNKPLEDFNKLADEFVFICEENGKAIGYIQVANYHVVKGERPDDDIGIIGEIFVKPEYRKQDISLKLLNLGVQKLIDCGKFRAICNVQEDNKYRYLHFAMADGNVVHEDICKRQDGSKTIDYTLMIDLKQLNEDLIKGKFSRRVGKYHLKITRENNQDFSL